MNEKSASRFQCPPGHIAMTFTVLGGDDGGNTIITTPETFRAESKRLRRKAGQFGAEERRAVWEMAVSKVLWLSDSANDASTADVGAEVLPTVLVAIHFHPDSKVRKTVLAGMDTMIRRQGGAHLKALCFPERDGIAWVVYSPDTESAVH